MDRHIVLIAKGISFNYYVNICLCNFDCKSTKVYYVSNLNWFKRKKERGTNESNIKRERILKNWIRFDETCCVDNLYVQFVVC